MHEKSSFVLIYLLNLTDTLWLLLILFSSFVFRNYSRKILDSIKESGLHADSPYDGNICSLFFSEIKIEKHFIDHFTNDEDLDISEKN